MYILLSHIQVNPNLAQPEQNRLTSFIDVKKVEEYKEKQLKNFLTFCFSPNCDILEL